MDARIKIKFNTVIFHLEELATDLNRLKLLLRYVTPLRSKRKRSKKETDKLTGYLRSAEGTLEDAENQKKDIDEGLRLIAQLVQKHTITLNKQDKETIANARTTCDTLIADCRALYNRISST